MSAFYDNNITDVGRLLLADIQSGSKFVPTKIVIGSGYMPQGKTTRTMTDVAEVVKELSLNKVQKTSDGSVIFGAAFSNEDILEPFYYRELGLYAKGVYYNAEGEPSNETEEVLYSYGNAGDNAELIPAYSEGSITERQLDLIVYIGNDTEVVLNIEAGIYVTMPVFTEQIEKINKEIITIKADFDGINDKIGITTDDEGTVSTGTVFGKLNSILLYLTVTLVEKLSKITEDISENKTSIGNAEDLSTSPTIFGKLAEIKEIITSKFADIISKIAGIDSKIGTTTDTGGTSSAGGIFAKLNKLLTDWTTTRASRIDSIYTNTNTSTTSSSTGTLCQRLNYIRTLIGTSSDSGTTTLFGKISDIQENSISQSEEIIELNDKIGVTNDITASVTDGTMMGKLNVLIENLIGGVETFTTDGVFKVPSGVSKIYVTAAGGGGGGGCSYNDTYVAGGAGGGGGASIVKQPYSVTPGSSISIKIGHGGQGGTSSDVNGKSGTATVVGSLVTLAGGTGGAGGKYVSSPTVGQIIANGGAAGGTGGGSGGSSVYTGYDRPSTDLREQIVQTTTGKNGAIGTGGSSGSDYYYYAAGGGGSYGNGGYGGKTKNPTSGGGGCGGTQQSSNDNGQNGANGIVIIEW